MSVPTQNPEVVGWGRAGAAWASTETPSLSRALADALHGLGVERAFGLLGGGIAPFAAGLSQSPIRFHSFRHEAGAGFAAIEAYMASGRPSLAVVTTGPGLLNILNPLMAARMDGAKLLLISGFTSRAQAGRGAVQETSHQSMPVDLLRPGCFFDEVCIPESPEELVPFLARLQRAWAGPGGCVAHLGLPLSLQTRLLEGPLKLPSGWSISPPRAPTEALDRTLLRLLDPSALLWVGSGANGASAALRRFAEAAGLPVVSSPRAKGVFPESHPLFVGVSGAGGSPAVRQHFAARPPTTALVVGTRLGEVTSFLAPAMTPTVDWIHVDLDPAAFGAAFPERAGQGIVAEAGGFLTDLHARAEATGWFNRRRPAEALRPHTAQALSPRAAGDVRPPYLLQEVQRAVVVGSDALVMSEAGTSFTWCNALLRFEAPGRYRTSPAWGSMGHFTTGPIGAALTGRRVVTVVGDGAMLMNNEINTAVQYKARVLWIVLNDAQLGLNEHGMTALGMQPVETQLPRTDFVAFARSQGADGLAVRTEPELAAALEQALAAEGPFVLDVTIDRSFPSPVVAERVASLQRQAAAARGEA